MKTKFAVIVFPGSNCDHDAYYALKKTIDVDVEFVWHRETNLRDHSAILIPGGFSYGDYLRTGAIARFSPIMRSVIDSAKKGKPVIGICNGFQILIEAGLLPGALLRNKYLKFICKNVFVKINNTENEYFKNIKQNILELHIAHNEGNYYCSDQELKSINDNNQIAINYCNKKGDILEESNPNGSISNIAGIFNKEKNILGMMPHPERMIDSYLSGKDGSIFFENLIGNLK